MLLRDSIIAMMALFAAFSCQSKDTQLETALGSAGENRPTIEAVLKHYRTQDPVPEKFKAALFLIKNMPAHYSYMGDSIYLYYDYAQHILSNDNLTPESQRDSLLMVTKRLYSHLPERTVPDTRVISKDYLIHNIDLSYDQWKNCPWASQLTFEEYLEWLLPYKAVDLQELDYWRDTLSLCYGDGMRNPVVNDVEYNTTTGVADMIRNEVLGKINRHGLYTESGLPLLSASLLHRQTFGHIPDYALLAALSFRSMGVPVVIDETPVGARDEAATRWFVILSDRGKEVTSEWDLATQIGWSFFPYERGPKVFRQTYAIDDRRLDYIKNAKYVYPFDITVKDVTDKYFLSSHVSVTIEKHNRSKLKDRYVYIASAIRSTQDHIAPSAGPEPDGWKIVDFCKLRGSKAVFRNMGREVMYIVLGYDGVALVPISDPFILKKDGTTQYVSADTVFSPYLNKWCNKPI